MASGFKFSNIFNGYVNSFNGTKQSTIIATLAYSYGINTIESFINEISKAVDTLPINLPTDIMNREQTISYAGALVLQNLIIKKLETIKSNTPEGIAMRQTIKAQHAAYKQEPISDDVIIEQANLRLLGYFKGSEFRDKLVGDMPTTGSLNAGSKEANDGYSKYLRDLFGNQTLNNIRTIYLEPVGAVTQCSHAVCNRPSTGTCYLCGCWWNASMADVSPSLVECEHILPVLPALSHLWLYRTFNTEAGTTMLVDKALKDALSIEYAWSHKCCNQIKSDKNFTKLNKATGKYEIDNDAVTLFLMALKSSNRPECIAINQYCPNPYPTECDRPTPACPDSLLNISTIAGEDKLPCNIEYTGLTTGSTVIGSALKLKSNTILEKRLQDIVKQQNDNLLTISTNMKSGHAADRDYYYYLVLCKFKLMAAIDEPSFLHDMLLGWSKPQKPKGIGDEISVDPCLDFLEKSKTKIETEVESMLNKMTELNNAILNKVVEVKKRFPGIIVDDHSINPDLYAQMEQQMLVATQQAKVAYDQAKANHDQFIEEQRRIRNQAQGSEAMAALVAAASANPNAPRLRRKRGLPEISVEEKALQDAQEEAESVFEISKKEYDLLTRFYDEIQSLQGEYISKTGSYNTKNAKLQETILQITAYNTTYEQVYTTSINSGEFLSAQAHEQARQAARTAAGCDEASASSAIAGGMEANPNLSITIPKSMIDSSIPSTPYTPSGSKTKKKQVTLPSTPTSKISKPLSRKFKKSEFLSKTILPLIQEEDSSLSDRRKRMQEIINKAPSLPNETKNQMEQELAKDLNYPTQQDLIILELLTDNKFNPTPFEINASINAVFLPPKLTGGQLPYTKKKTTLPFTSRNIQMKHTRKRDKKSKSSSSSLRGRTTTQRGGKSKCFVQNMSDGNIRIISGRRRYITKNFNLDPRAQLYINQNANLPNVNCIKIAQHLDNQLKKLRKSRKKK